MIWITKLDTELPFEHSLVSLSEWEAEHEKPFYPRTPEDKLSEKEMIRYFELMYRGPRKHFDLIQLFGGDEYLELVEYINSPRTATIVREVQSKAGPKEHITSELMYYWLVAFKIPFKPTDEWHINRLLTLVRVCGVKQDTPKKRKDHEIARDFRAENARRRALYGTKG